ncbi:hypothetical protein C2845_PM05G18650 [Panicum miliaceum]|uniref:DUF4408 domain-containing protein n=1 Tax=Panicum miliaceum TaxID=4540 RepID=A0A3L6SWR3_PANMI|nr:hypothetical protein C2845_PM05G18650 [Panicum miliaceum]
MTIAMDVRSCMKATLLAILILSVVTWLSHLYSCIKNFMESLPCVVSPIIAPKCLFIFSNIIVVYLVSESKLSRRRSKLLKIGDEAAARDEDMLQDIRKQHDHGLTEVLLPTILGESKQEQENKMAMVVDEEKDVQMLIMVPEERETSIGNDGVRLNQCDEKVNQLVLHSIHEVQEEAEEGKDLELELGEEVSGDVQQERAMEEESEEWDLPTADELNRRVEDFIARFNMERQLEEARMPVCCY